MLETEIKSYLSAKKYNVKISANNHLQVNCPFCEDRKYHMYINSRTGMWDCKLCGESGSWNKFRKKHGDFVRYLQKTYVVPKPRSEEAFHTALLRDQQAMKYLIQERGLKKEVIINHKIGLRQDHNGHKWLVFPYYKDEKLVNLKYRRLTLGKEYRREKDCESTLYNIDNADLTKPVILTEGEIDCMSLISAGIGNVIAVPNGAGSFEPEWVECLMDVDRIYLAYDMDKAGREGTVRAADMLGRYRCSILSLPLNDINDCLKAGFTQQDFQKLIDEAESAGSDEIVPVSSIVAEILEWKPEDYGLPTGLKALDETIRGWRYGELTVISGSTGQGKTSFLRYLVYKLVKQKIPVLVYPFEVIPLTYIKKMLSIQEGCSFFDMDRGDKMIAVERFRAVPLYFFNPSARKKINASVLLDTMSMAIKRFGIKMFAIDHLHYFLDRRARDVSQEIGATMRDLSMFCVQKEVHVFLVAHCRKNLSKAGGGLEDIRDSSFIAQDAHNVIMISWPDPEKNEALINIEKNRKWGKHRRYSIDFDPETYAYLAEGRTEYEIPDMDGEEEEIPF